MIEITETIERKQANEEPTKGHLRTQKCQDAGTVREAGTPQRVASDSAVNELMIRRIIAALADLD